MKLSITCLLLFGLILCALIIAFLPQNYNNYLCSMLCNFREVVDKNIEITGGGKVDDTKLIINNPIPEICPFPPGRTF